MEPRDIISEQTDYLKGKGSLSSEDLQLSYVVEYEIRVYNRMAWTGGGSPRENIGKTYKVSVRCKEDDFLTLRFKGFPATLTLEDGKKMIGLVSGVGVCEFLNSDRRGLFRDNDGLEKL